MPFFVILLLIPLLLACGGNSSANEAWTLPEGTGSRDATPVCLVPEEGGETVLGTDTVSIDCSNVQEGYVIARYTGVNPKVKLQITGIDGIIYTYDLKTDGTADVFPLSSGDGVYNIAVYENITLNKYSTLFSDDITVTMRDPFLPFLYPNQYVRFSAEKEAIAMGQTLATPANNDLDVISNVFNYIIRNITYDTDEAETVESGYIPDVDEVLSSGKGICLDYAALMTAMLRSQQIPTRMEIGYAGTAYHAWISCFIENAGWVNGIIEFDGKSWQLMDPTFAASMDKDKLKSFIGDGSNYVLKYIY